jgi:acyl carrier protein
MNISAVQPSTNAQTLTELKEIVIEVTKAKISPTDISDAANLFDDCGLDSSSVVDLVLALEEKYNITMSEDQLEVELFQNASNLADFIETLRAATRGVQVA